MSAADLLLAIDQGTTSTRAILFDTTGAVRRIAAANCARSIRNRAGSNTTRRI